MPIDFLCTCGIRLRAPEKLAGKNIRCQKCGQVVLVPLSVVDRAATAKPISPAPVGVKPIQAKAVSKAPSLGNGQSAGVATPRDATAVGSQHNRPQRATAQPNQPVSRRLGTRPAGAGAPNRKVPAANAPSTAAKLRSKSNTSAAVGSAFHEEFADLSILPVPAQPVHYAPANAYSGPSAYSNISSTKKRKAGRSMKWLVPVAIAGGALLGGLLVVSVSAFAYFRIQSIANASKTPVAEALPQENVIVAVTEEEALRAANQFVEAVRRRDVLACSQVFNMDRLLERVSDGIDVPESFKTRILQTIRSTSMQSFVSQIAKELSAGGQYDVLQALATPADTRVVVRLLGAGGLNYHELIMGRSESGEAAISDIRILLMGESIGDLYRRGFLIDATNADRSLAKRLPVKMRDWASVGAQIQRLPQLIATNPSEALRLIETFPESLREEKMLMVFELQAARLLDDAAYLRTLERFRRVHNNDVAADLASIDYFVLRNEFEEAVGCVQRLRDSIGGDPLLDTMADELRKL